jgi:hypothetical protein
MQTLFFVIMSRAMGLVTVTAGLNTFEEGEKFSDIHKIPSFTQRWACSTPFQK